MKSKLVILLLVIFCQTIFSQEKAVGNVSISKLPAKEKRWALIIGVSQYDDGNITPLPGANNDARELRDALRDYAGFDERQIITLTTDESKDRQPTKNNILRYLGNLSGTVPKDGLLLVAFSGHGIERQKQAFLLASDTPYNDNLRVLERTAISVSDDFKELIRDTGVGQVIILLDACRNDPSSGRSGSDNPLTQAYKDGFSFDLRNKEVEAFATLYATSIGERAYEYTRENKGYFTWAFIEGLKGGAANASGEITLGSLIRYVEKQVPQQVKIDLGSKKLQRPFSIIEGYKAEELVLGLTRITLKRRQSSTVNTESIETTFWLKIENSINAEDFENYLSRCQSKEFNCIYKVPAELKLKQLKASGGKSKTVSWKELPLVKGKIIPRPDTAVFGEKYQNSLSFLDDIIVFRTAKKYGKLIMKIGIQDNAEARGNKHFIIKDENRVLFEGDVNPNRRPVEVEIDISDSDVIGFTHDNYNGATQEFVRYMDVTFVIDSNPDPTLNQPPVNDAKGIGWADMPLVKGKAFRRPDTAVFGDKYPNSLSFLDDTVVFRTAKKYRKLIMLIGVQDNPKADGSKHFFIKNENGVLFEGDVRANRRPLPVEIDISESDLIGFTHDNYNGATQEFVRYINVIFVPK